MNASSGLSDDVLQAQIIKTSVLKKRKSTANKNNYRKNKDKKNKTHNHQVRVTTQSVPCAELVDTAGGLIDLDVC
jgi:hypothetical protein